MSEDWIIVVANPPKHLPTSAEAEAALELLKILMPDAVEIETAQNEFVQFFDCGANLETISCPNCSAVIDFYWWGETMSSDYDEASGFHLNKFQMPCCATAASLNELNYDFHQAFGRFTLSAMNPNIGKLSEEAVTEVEAALGCSVSVVYQHI